MGIDMVYIDKGKYLIAYSEGFKDHHLIDKSKTQSFLNNEQKLEFRINLFLDLKNHAHYRKWFATDKKKGYITPHHIEFILAWIKETIDLDQNELTIANRNLLINKKLKDQISNHLHIDELLSVLQGRIRHNEEGIVDIPFNMKRSEYSNYMAKLNS